MYKNFLFTPLLFISLFTKAQGYNVSSIPPNLLKNANMVVRMDRQSLEILDSAKLIFTHKYAYTILNSAGEKYATFTDSYDKFQNIQNISGTLYDETGKKIKSLKKSDISDLSGTDSQTLADDSRYKQHDFNWRLYPYTVEYEVIEQWNGILVLPNWRPVSHERIAVEDANFEVISPISYKLGYKAFNQLSPPSITETNNKKKYLWTIQNIPAIEYENFQPDLYEVTPSLFLSPGTFSIQNYTGHMTSWKSFGEFYYNLNKNRDELPENLKAKVHSLTDGLHTVMEKVDALYTYMQKNTRYVSIQLGIGGWQTLDANFVATKGYGDCKALSNFMMSLLKEAGIKSNCLLIQGGDYPKTIITDFTCDQFNHVILCVPQTKDSIWLECTAQTLPTGYLSKFTSNRYAVFIDETNSKLVHTPVYKTKDNLQLRHVTAQMDSDGNLKAKIKTHFYAEQQDDLSQIINYLSKEKVEEILKENLSLPTYDVLSFKYEEVKSSLPIIKEDLDISVSNFGIVTGKRLFIAPNLLNRSSSRIPEPENRKFGFKFVSGWIDRDTVEISIPKGYVPESIPADVKLIAPFASYQSSVSFKLDKIIYVRISQRNPGEYPVKEAKVIAEYFDKIYNADRERIVLVKNSL